MVAVSHFAHNHQLQIRLTNSCMFFIIHIQLHCLHTLNLFKWTWFWIICCLKKKIKSNHIWLSSLFNSICLRLIWNSWFSQVYSGIYSADYMQNNVFNQQDDMGPFNLSSKRWNSHLRNETCSSCDCIKMFIFIFSENQRDYVAATFKSNLDMPLDMNRDHHPGFEVLWVIPCLWQEKTVPTLSTFQTFLQSVTINNSRHQTSQLIFHTCYHFVTECNLLQWGGDKRRLNL